MLDDDARYRAMLGRDARFDGVFFVGVTSTGIYCRPSCPAITPKRENVRFFRTAAAAHAHGFRACKRCRPDSVPGSPEWNARADVVGRAMRLIADGVVDREGVRGLAARLGYSERQLNRQLIAELGAAPLAIARAHRLVGARILLETTKLPVTKVAFASGFGSVRQFNDSIREMYAMTPTELRARAARRGGAAQPAEAGALTIRLPYRTPFDAPRLFGFLGARAVPGVESWDGETYARTVRLTHGTAIVSLRPLEGHVSCTLRLENLRDLAAAVERCRRLLDLDADPVAIDAALSTISPLGRLARRLPGTRVPGHVDGGELVVRALLGQQVSVGAARTLAERLVQRFGEPLPQPAGKLTHTFPTPEVLAEADPATLPGTRSRAAAIRSVSAALADGTLRLDPGAERAQVRTRLLEVKGIGEWTASYVALRALGDPDVFLGSDLGVVRALDRLRARRDGLGERVRPWGSYATMMLWSSLEPSGKRKEIA